MEGYLSKGIAEDFAAVETFIGEVTYYDPKEGKFITREMYWGDYSVSTYWVSENGTPKMFTGLKASLIDKGSKAVVLCIR